MNTNKIRHFTVQGYLHNTVAIVERGKAIERTSLRLTERTSPKEQKKLETSSSDSSAGRSEQPRALLGQQPPLTVVRQLTSQHKGRTIRKVMGGGGGVGDFQLVRIFFFAHCLCRNFFFQVKPPARIFFFRQILLFLTVKS